MRTQSAIKPLSSAAPIAARQNQLPRMPRMLWARGSVLAWPAWLRVLAVLVPVAALWLAVAWAQVEVAPW